ncbi:ribosome biogenesis GTPase YlqF [Mycoplasma sp. P36-A1]|uniref:ribosome biogenesis GTPase YlqF n=1 Tax=Mycoplasma sp. P36-A1 TaxID=3252900 RepID=UPI003C30D5BD
MATIHWFPGHMAKARRLIEEKIKLIDIVIEIVDARIPYSSKNPMMDKLVHNKQKVMLLSKTDLADPTYTKEWVKYYEEKGYEVIATNLLDFKEMNRLVNKAKVVLKPKFEKDAKRGLKPRAIRALIVGIPNVGKSTLINKMAKRKSAKTGDKAGVTKALQWIKVNKEFELLDSPGILWPKFEDKQVAINLALTGAIKEEILPKDELCIYCMKFLNTYYKEHFYKRYSLTEMDNDNLDSIIAAMDHIANVRKAILPGNQVDYDKVYDIVLRESRNGTIAPITFDVKFTE